MHRFLPRSRLSMLDEIRSTYRMDMLKSSNWMPWQRRMLAVLRQLGLNKYIWQRRDNRQEIEAEKKWSVRDAKAQIDFAMGDAEMIHISGAMTAREMSRWKLLIMVEKSEDGLPVGTLATRRELYSATAAEVFEHISNLWKS